MALEAVVAGGIGQHLAEGRAAEAGGKIAKEREARAQQERQDAIAAAEPSARELMLMDKQLQVTERSIARQESLLDAVDPALKEAGSQALALLQGKEAGTLEPLRRDRARQRATLENQLRGQLGNDYATSSAGIEALSRFDESTSSVTAQAQQSALGQLLGSAQQTRSQVHPEQFGNMYGSIVGEEQNIRSRGLNARLGTGTAQYAGSQYYEDLAKSKNTAESFGGISQLGMTAITSASSFASGGMGGGMGSAPKVRPQSTETV